MGKIDIASMTIEELTAKLEDIGEKKFRATQIYSWLHVNHAFSFEEMSNLSKGLRQKLDEIFAINIPNAIEVLESSIDGTRKYLFKLYDGNVIESVLMRYKHGNSVCISSQAGCRMGCKFCASTLNGLERNLTPSEMLGQIYAISKDIGERISNVVVMGSGEPLDNFDNIIRFVDLLTNDKGINISQRNLTISTCGIVPKIYELADMDHTFTLAISLHSPTDELRRQIMSIANAYTINELLDAVTYYYQKTKRRITFEYTLISEFNDSKECALRLVSLMNQMKENGVICHVNLIPVNAVKERDFVHSQPAFIVNFKNTLEKNRINVTIRREMGSDINAACGQLRKSYIDSQEQGKVL